MFLYKYEGNIWFYVKYCEISMMPSIQIILIEFQNFTVFSFKKGFHLLKEYFFPLSL